MIMETDKLFLTIPSDSYSGSSKVIVAIIDTGTELTHPDLAPNIWVNSKEIPNNGIDDDKNGYIDDYNGYSFAGKCSGYDPSTRLCNQVSMSLGSTIMSLDICCKGIVLKLLLPLSDLDPK